MLALPFTKINTSKTGFFLTGACWSEREAAARSVEDKAACWLALGGKLHTYGWHCPLTRDTSASLPAATVPMSYLGWEQDQAHLTSRGTSTISEGPYQSSCSAQDLIR